MASIALTSIKPLHCMDKYIANVQYIHLWMYIRLRKDQAKVGEEFMTLMYTILTISHSAVGVKAVKESELV